MTEAKEMPPFYRLATQEDLMGEIAAKVREHAEIVVRSRAEEIRAMSGALVEGFTGDLSAHVLMAQDLPGGRRVVFLKRKDEVEGLDE